MVEWKLYIENISSNKAFMHLCTISLTHSENVLCDKDFMCQWIYRISNPMCKGLSIFVCIMYYFFSGGTQLQALSLLQSLKEMNGRHGPSTGRKCNRYVLYSTRLNSLYTFSMLNAAMCRLSQLVPLLWWNHLFFIVLSYYFLTWVSCVTFNGNYKRNLDRGILYIMIQSWVLYKGKI